MNILSNVELKGIVGGLTKDQQALKDAAIANLKEARRLVHLANNDVLALHYDGIKIPGSYDINQSTAVTHLSRAIEDLGLIVG